MKEVYKVICKDCGKVVAKLDMDYITKNPNTSEEYIESLLREHRSKDVKCPGHINYEIKCPYCGQTLATYDENYAYNNPNGLDMWEDELINNHLQFCKEFKRTLPDEEIEFEGSLKFSNSTKDYKIISYPVVDQRDGGIDWEYRIEWEKGGTNATDPDEIAEQWWEAIVSVVKDIAIEYRYEFIEDAQYKCAYEVSKKNDKKYSVSFNIEGYDLHYKEDRRTLIR